ncbi:hypothetical protein D3C78_19080 [compost metagenome]
MIKLPAFTLDTEHFTARSPRPLSVYVRSVLEEFEQIINRSNITPYMQHIIQKGIEFSMVGQYEENVVTGYLPYDSALVLSNLNAPRALITSVMFSMPTACFISTKLRTQYDHVSRILQIEEENAAKIITYCYMHRLYTGERVSPEYKLSIYKNLDGNLLLPLIHKTEEMLFSLGGQTI